MLECANDELSVVQDVQIRNDTIVKMAVFVQNHQQIQWKLLTRRIACSIKKLCWTCDNKLFGVNCMANVEIL